MVQLLVAAIGQYVVGAELLAELPCRGAWCPSDGLGRTIVGVLGEEERDHGEDVLEEALPNAIRCCRRWVEVVVPATAPFQKP